MGEMNRWILLLIIAPIACVLVDECTALVPFVSQSSWGKQSADLRRLPGLAASAGGPSKKRRRKQPPGGVGTPDPVKVSLEKPDGVVDSELDDDDDDENDRVLTDQELINIEDVARFEFKARAESNNMIVGIQDAPVASKDSETAVPLPDIKEAQRKRKMEEELARIEEEKKEAGKIRRDDKAALAKLLERNPFADADDSLFVEEEYTPVSALLGERAKPFLGIPSGPLQVGHFMGALGIVLMAFVEYPGFPLTNLPSALRGALQGGLGAVYAINTILAILAVFKAMERGQPVSLWVAKTFTVGGLAFDQLTQLPTLDEMEKARSVKGKRAMKPRKN